MFRLFRHSPAVPVEKPLSELDPVELLSKLKNNLSEPVLNEVLRRANEKDNNVINATYLRALLLAYNQPGISEGNKDIISDIFVASLDYLMIKSSKYIEVRQMLAIASRRIDVRQMLAIASRRTETTAAVEKTEDPRPPAGH